MGKQALPPCHTLFQFYVVEGKLSCQLYQRSGDVFLGVPYDVALFSQLLLYISEQVDLLPGKMEMQIIDAHVYVNQTEAVKEYLSKPILPQPSYDYLDGQLVIKNYQHGPVITATVAV